MRGWLRATEVFLSTPSARRATLALYELLKLLSNFYPRPPRGGRLDVLLRAAAHSSISIHALREEGDLRRQHGARRSRISIHALREEGDPASALPLTAARFLSTPSARRATVLLPEEDPPQAVISIHALREEGDVAGHRQPTHHRNFYPRPPRGGRRPLLPCRRHRNTISIHALREEGDLAEKLLGAQITISIHALREEGDVKRTAKTVVFERFLSTPSARRATVPLAASSRSLLYFYPRPPRGGRHHAAAQVPAHAGRFLSTPSARRATRQPGGTVRGHRISIHALREEGDAPGSIARGRPCDFYPRPPRGGRLVRCKDLILGQQISIHALREEGDPP